MEKRTATRTFEIRAAQGEEFVLAGRALSYNQISSNELAPGVREKLLPRMFCASLARGSNVIANLNHNMEALPLGTTDNKTLKIQDGSEGLDFRVQLDRNITSHCDVYASVKRGDIFQCSFQFVCLDEDIEEGKYNGADCLVRCVKQADLIDVAVCTNPFYGNAATAVAARNAAGTKTADEQRRARAAAVGKLVESDKRGLRIQAAGAIVAVDKRTHINSTDVSSAREAHAIDEALKAYGYWLVSCTDEHCFGVPTEYDGDSEEEDCFRFHYQLDDKGHVIVDNDSREVYHGWVKHADEDSRARYYAILPERRQAFADAELERRMRQSAGIFTR